MVAHVRERIRVEIVALDVSPTRLRHLLGFLCGAEANSANVLIICVGNDRLRLLEEGVDTILVEGLGAVAVIILGPLDGALWEVAQGCEASEIREAVVADVGAVFELDPDGVGGVTLVGHAHGSVVGQGLRQVGAAWWTEAWDLVGAGPVEGGAVGSEDGVKIA